jgi:uncharacterized protein
MSCPVDVVSFAALEILILGTGKSALPPPPELREYISKLGISLDIMDTVSLSCIDASAMFLSLRL